jgi:hypothetical protein
MRKPLARASGDLPPHFQFMQLISVRLYQTWLTNVWHAPDAGDRRHLANLGTIDFPCPRNAREFPKLSYLPATPV